MRRTKLAGLTAVATAAAIMVLGGFASRPAISGHEVFKIVGTTPGPRHAKVTAKGAFDANGYFFRKKASLIFPKGRLVVKRHVLSTTNTPPNLATCRFKVSQHGTFRVSYSTGKYRKVRFSGQYWSHVSARLKQTGPDQCGSKIVHYHFVTYEIGNIPDARLVAAAAIGAYRR
jgi:hypothetical protein